MKVAVISDVHGNMPALQAVLDEIGDMQIYCAGDLVGYGTQPNEVIETLWERNAVCIMGNHDYAVVKGHKYPENKLIEENWKWTKSVLTKSNLTYLKHLKTEYDEENILMVHGSPKDPINEYIYDLDLQFDDLIPEFGEDILIFGHTHIPVNREYKGRLFLNPGSIGQPRDGDKRASYAVLDVDWIRAKISRLRY